jgi:hypothetical protein
MAVKKKNTPKKTHEKPPPLDQWIKPAVGIALALLGYQFFKGMVQQEIHRVNLDDELELREVLFGEIVETEDKKIPQNYAVLCHPETATYPISSVFQDAHKEASSVATFRVMDCDTVMAGSEKTAKERFKLNDKTRPLVFVSGKQGPPKQVRIVWEGEGISKRQKSHSSALLIGPSKASENGKHACQSTEELAHSQSRKD